MPRRCVPSVPRAGDVGGDLTPSVYRYPARTRHRWHRWRRAAHWIAYIPGVELWLGTLGFFVSAGSS
jgi:hypothetical protein